MDVKDIRIMPISTQDANKIVKSIHYSGKVVPNSQIHFGVFLDDKCGGALQFGPSMRKDLICRLVNGTGWDEFIELNRMAFSDWLPRNSESRAIAYCLRYLKNKYPKLKWVVSFADATQCGDGTIYRASGFVLTQIKSNSQIRINPCTNKPMQSMAAFHKCLSGEFKNWRKLVGYQLRYIYFLKPEEKANLTVPILPFSKIDEMGARMYKGKKLCASGVTNSTVAFQAKGSGANPTFALQVA